MSRPHEKIACITKSPAAMGYQDNLYALLNVGEDLTQWLERNFFQTTDDQASKVMVDILGGKMLPDGRWRSGWSRFIMSLMSRTPDRIEFIKGAYEAEIPNFLASLEQAYDEDMAGREPPPSAEEKKNAIEQQISIGTGKLIQSVMDLQNVGTEINQMRWRVLVISDGGRDFLTSDKPVYLSHGLQNDDAFFSLPISPRKLFLASKSEAQLDRIEKFSKADLTQAVNKTVVQQATKYVYGTDDSQRNFVDKHLRT